MKQMKVTYHRGQNLSGKLVVIKLAQIQICTLFKKDLEDRTPQGQYTLYKLDIAATQLRIRLNK